MRLKLTNANFLSAKGLTNIPLEITELDLSGNALGLKIGAEIENFIAQLANTPVLAVNLSDNRLRHRSGNELGQALAKLPLHVNRLDLSKNGFSLLPVIELILALRKISSRVINLSLASNNLGRKSGEELAQLMTNIPSGVIVLDLSNNLLYCRQGIEIAQMAAAIPAHVTSVNLTKNNLHQLSLSNLKEHQLSAPFVDTLFLSCAEAKLMTTEQRKAFNTLFPNIKNVVFLDENNKDIGCADPQTKMCLTRAFGFPVTSGKTSQYGGTLFNKKVEPSANEFCNESNENLVF